MNLFFGPNDDNDNDGVFNGRGKEIVKEDVKVIVDEDVSEEAVDEAIEIWKDGERR